MNFALVSRPELNLLVELPKSAICVYLALSSYCREHSNCWPSINTLHKALAGKISIRSIYDGLKALEDIGLIVRNHRRSTNRFLLRVREMWRTLRQQAVCESSQSSYDANSRTRNKDPKESLRNRHKGNKSGFLDQLKPQKLTKEDLKEQLIAQLTMNDQIDNRLPALMEPQDWDWLKEYHPIKARTLALMNA